jgi:hypothetical protein
MNSTFLNTLHLPRLIKLTLLTLLSYRSNRVLDYTTVMKVFEASIRSVEVSKESKNGRDR